MTERNFDCNQFARFKFVRHDVGMSERFSPTIRRRRLGLELRGLRQTANMTAAQVHEELEISLAKLNKIENGRQDVSQRDLIAMLTIYGAPERIRELTELRREVREEGWWQRLGVAPGAYVDFEAGAGKIKIHAPALIPGLLQTEEYARAVYRALRPDLDPEGIDRQVEVRMRRAELLDSPDAPLLTVVLGEAAARTQVGGPGVMADCLDHILDVAERNPERVTMRMIPFEAGEHAGLEGPFSILEFADAPTIAHAEYPTGAAWLEEVEEVRRCSLAFNHLQVAAEKPSETAAKLRAIRDGMRDTNGRQ